LLFGVFFLKILEVLESNDKDDKESSHQSIILEFESCFLMILFIYNLQLLF